MNEEIRKRYLGAVLERCEVEVPQWGKVWAQELGGDGRYAVELEVPEANKSKDFRRFMAVHLVHGVVAPDPATGEWGPVFTADDIPRLTKLSTRITVPVFKAIERLSALGPDAREEARGN